VAGASEKEEKATSQMNERQDLLASTTKDGWKHY